MRGKNMSVVLAVILLSGAVMAVGCGTTKKETPVQLETSETKETENFVEKNTVKPFTEESKKLFLEASNVTVEKVLRTTTEFADGSSEVEYQEYFVSDVDLKNKKDNTEDFAKAVSGAEFDDTLIEHVTFEEAFGFLYEDINGLDIYEDILKGNGIESDLNDGVFDEATYKMTGQKVYEFQNECITQMLLKDVSYDKLLDSKVFFEMVEEEGVEYPGYFSAVVQYESKGMTITKSLYVAVTVNNWQECSIEGEE